MSNQIKYSYVLSKDSPGVINPYTFIPLEKKTCKRVNAENYYVNKKELLTGVLHCRLYVQTPLAIPDVEKVEKESLSTGEHHRYPFYRIGKRMAIPGSSIRGELRSVYETMTNSCLSTLKDNTYISKREESINAYEPGILICKDGRYELYSAKRFLVPISAEVKSYRGLNGVKGYTFSLRNGKRQITIKGKPCRNGDKINFNYNNTTYEKRGHKVWDGIVAENGTHKAEGILYLGEKFGSKHGESIFVKNNLIKSEEILKKQTNEKHLELDEAYKRLLKTKDYYRDTSINKNFGKEHTGYYEFDDLSLENGIPLWYKEISGHFYFSYASIGRVIYHNALNDLVGSYSSCKDRKNLCEACLLFGMIGGRGENGENLPSMGSRIRVTDAYITAESGGAKSHYVTLKELGSPHTSYLPFYAHRENGKVPTSYDEKDVSVSGRKFYWHHINAKKTESEYDYRAENDAKTVRNSTMEVVEPGAEFAFDIFYDGITKSQLNKLMWDVTFGENKKDSELCHELGHGKPLGLGSVKIVIDSDQRRIFNGESYCIETTDAANLIINCDDNKEISRLKRVADMRIMNDEVEKGIIIDYPDLLDKNGKRIPLAEQQGQQGNKKARHQWYYQNKKIKNGKQNIQTLPPIDSDPKDQELKLYKVIVTRDSTGN